MGTHKDESIALAGGFEVWRTGGRPGLAPGWYAENLKTNAVAGPEPTREDAEREAHEMRDIEEGRALAPPAEWDHEAGAGRRRHQGGVLPSAPPLPWNEDYEGERTEEAVRAAASKLVDEALDMVKAGATVEQAREAMYRKAGLIGGGRSGEEQQ